MKFRVVISTLLLLQAACIVSKHNNHASMNNNHVEDVHTSSIGLSAKDQKMSADILNHTLANEFVLMMQTLKYHWNLVGEKFHDYHLLFDKQYNQLFADLDLIAERIRAVGVETLGSLEAMIHHSSLKEDTGVTPKPQEMVKHLVKQYKHHTDGIRRHIKNLDKQSEDFGTKKMLEDLLEQHEKTAWMLRSLTGKK